MVYSPAGSFDLLFILDCMTLYLNFSTLHSSSLLWTDTIVCAKLNKPPFKISAPSLISPLLNVFEINKLACSRRSDSGERCAFFTSHRSPLSERLEQAINKPPGSSIEDQLRWRLRGTKIIFSIVIINRGNFRLEDKEKPGWHFIPNKWSTSLHSFWINKHINRFWLIYFTDNNAR